MIKTIKNIIAAILLSGSLLLPAQAQNNAAPGDELIFKALTDELARNSTDLTLKDYKPPFFISYQLYDLKTLLIKATMGSIRQTQDMPLRVSNVRCMAGDYSLNDENFLGAPGMPTGGGYLPVPLENDYAGIRRAFWISTDRIYKSAVQKYDQKLTALKQQNQAENEKIDDYTKAGPLNYISKEPDYKIEKEKWENIARDVSGIFKTYGDITASTTYVYLVKAWTYHVSSEGARIKFPVHLAALMVNAYTQAEDGEPIVDHLLYFASTPEQLPPLEKVKAEVKQMADNLVTLRKAPGVTESYAGPVIFEGEAVAELFMQKLFAPNAGLYAMREPVKAVERQGYSQNTSNRFDNRVGQKICSGNIHIKATSKTKTYNGIPLVGAFEVDAEGTIPPDELVLVQNGILKTLLNGRTPTPQVKESNGHNRLIRAGNNFMAFKSPGVVNISYENGKQASAFRKEILEEYAKNGLEYIYVIKKLQVYNTAMNNVMTSTANRNLTISKPIAIYKVSTKTGEEQLVRSAIINDFQTSAFKQIPYGTTEQIVYNTAAPRVGLEIPASFIVPQALVFEDISIEPDKGMTRTKLPVVPNPVLAAK